MVGDPAGTHRLTLLWAQALLQQRHGLQLALPDRGGVLFDPAITGVLNREGHLGGGDRHTAGVEENRTGAAGALIEG